MKKRQIKKNMKKSRYKWWRNKISKPKISNERLFELFNNFYDDIIKEEKR